VYFISAACSHDGVQKTLYLKDTSRIQQPPLTGHNCSSSHWHISIWSLRNKDTSVNRTVNGVPVIRFHCICVCVLVYVNWCWQWTCMDKMYVCMHMCVICTIVRKVFLIVCSWNTINCTDTKWSTYTSYTLFLEESVFIGVITWSYCAWGILVWVYNYYHTWSRGLTKQMVVWMMSHCHEQ
jgi:hypothetical protein